jgi:hypothetical protein
LRRLPRPSLTLFLAQVHGVYAALHRDACDAERTFAGALRRVRSA